MRYLICYSFLMLFAVTVSSQSAEDFLPRNILKGKTNLMHSDSRTDSIYCYKKEENSSELVNDFRVYNESFDENGNVLVELTQRFQNEQWINTQKKTNTYNTNGKLISEVNQFYDEEGRGWFNSQKSDFTYNINGFLTKLEYSEFSGNDWNRIYRNQYVYFNNVDPDEFYQQVFEGGFWRNKFKVYYSYDGLGKITSSLFTLWDNPSNSWANINRTFETYDNQERLSITIREIYETSTDSWLNSTRTLYQYEEGNIDVRSINEDWINQDSTWKPAGDIQIFYGENELETERLERNYENGIYSNFFRAKRTYDENFNLKRIDNELNVNNLWSLISYCEYFHSSTVSSTNSEIFQFKSLCNIANPINNSTVIECPFMDKNIRLRVMNAEGKIVYDQKHSGQFSINKSLANGSYFFTFSKEQKLIETRKLIWKN